MYSEVEMPMCTFVALVDSTNQKVPNLMQYVGFCNNALMNLIEVNQSLIGQPLHYICRHFLLCPLSILYSFLNTFVMYFCTFCNFNQQWISVPHIVGYVYTLHIHNLISKENDRTKAKDMSFVKNRQSKNLSG